MCVNSFEWSTDANAGCDQVLTQSALPVSVATSHRVGQRPAQRMPAPTPHMATGTARSGGGLRQTTQEEASGPSLPCRSCAHLFTGLEGTAGLSEALLPAPPHPAPCADKGCGTCCSSQSAPFFIFLSLSCRGSLGPTHYISPAVKGQSLFVPCS